MYNHQIKAAIASGDNATDEVSAQWRALRSGQLKASASSIVVGPLVTTEWNQYEPYWDLCPGSGDTKAVTGCVATAMAQIMNYWEWPVKGVGSKSYTPKKNPDYGQLSVDFANTTYDWANMLDTYDSYKPDSYTSAQAKAVATLLYSCGVSVEMNYGHDESGAGVAGGDPCAMYALSTYFKYDPDSIKSSGRSFVRMDGTEEFLYSDTAWIKLLKEELDKKRPILYIGGGTDPHAFVCDGYRSDDYFHFNLGWGGSCDGFYTINNLKMTLKYDFTASQYAVMGIVPKVTETFTITFNANGHTTCNVSSWTQSVVGAGCTLPDATPETGYLFLGWSDSPTSKVANIGKPGEIVTPRRNLTFYAVTQKKGRLVYCITDTVNNEGTRPSWTQHGECKIDSVYEDGTGAGIILPEVTSDPGWIFKGWYQSTPNGMSYIGDPGDVYYPTENPVNIYAYWTDSEVLLYYVGMFGILMTSGPKQGWIEKGDGYTATFKAGYGYETLSASTTTVMVLIDDREKIDSCATFSDGILTISLTRKQLDKVKRYVVVSVEGTKAGPPVIPTASALATAGYDVTNNVVLCLQFTGEATRCNKIVLAGNYNNWNTDPSNMLKMQAMADFSGWYVAEFPYKEGKDDHNNPIYPQAKPVQLNNDGSFSWDNQSGDVNAWTHQGSEWAYVVKGLENEADVYYPKPGAYVYSISYWKNHNTPCNNTDKRNYTIRFLNWNGAELQSTQVKEGEMPVYTGTTPQRPEDGQYTYAFKGWSPAIVAATANADYTAQFTATQKVHDPITVRLYPGSASAWSSVYLFSWTDKEGEEPTGAWPGTRVSKDANGWWSYTFSKDLQDINIIWNNGTGAQTVDITHVTQSTCYSLNGTSGTKITTTTIDCNTPLNEGIDHSPIAYTPHKLLRDGQILILRDGKIYTFTGQEVK